MPGLRRRALLRGIGLAGLGALAGCTGGDGGDTPSGTPAPTPTASPPPTATPTSPPTATPTPRADQSVTVGATCSSQGTNFRFVPALQRVDVGTTVVWAGASQCKQQSLAYHPDNDRPLRMPEAADPWTSSVLKEGDTFEHTFETAGVYNYTGLYEEFGQVGIVIVGDPDPAGEPGLAEPQAELPEEARAALGPLLEEARAALS